jgi:hypothetical protein
MAGEQLLRADGAATVVLTTTAIAAAVFPASLGPILVGVSLVLFLAGCGLFLWAFALAVERSRTEAIGIGGLYFLAGTAPDAVRRRFLGLLTVQTVVTIAAASVRPFTSVAFGVLAPMFGLGIQGLWTARHGTFGPRPGEGAHATSPRGPE